VTDKHDDSRLGVTDKHDDSRLGVTDKHDESTRLALTQAMQSVSAALISGAMTLTELDGSGAILMLAKRDEMLTINASATWLVAYLQNASPTSAEQLGQLFAQQFGITQLQAELDAHLFLTHLAKQLA
jgi:hypothetical protein